MKLKKGPKIVIIIITVLLLIAAGVALFIMLKPKTTKVKEVKILNTIEKYDYHLKDTKTKRYKSMFRELEDILKSKEVDEELYVQKITEMFIYDFYSLADKSTKTDVGGLDFVHPNAIQNFLVNAEDTYYKYVENNIYGDRTQKLPEVDEILINATTKTTYIYNNTEYEAYKINAGWSYTTEEFSSYQKNAALTFIKDGIKLYLVELK